MSEQKTLNLDDKVSIKNLCDWELYFGRIETAGDVMLPSKGQTRISIGEIVAQVHSNNTMFTGVDGRGNHARIYIDDKATRVHVGFEDEESIEPQFVLDAKAVSDILALPQGEFELAVQDKVVTQAEKNILIEEAKKQNLNDFGKIKYIEEYTGYPFEEKVPQVTQGKPAAKAVPQGKVKK